MLRIQRMLRLTFFFASLLVCTGVGMAQQCPENDATLPANPISYPKASDQYAVQYQIDGGAWTNALVYISYYGKTDASPKRGNAPYVRGTTAMSFVSIPAYANALVQIRVTNLFDGPFLASDQVTVRPTPKLVNVETNKDGTVQFSRFTPRNFDGEQFILLWNRGTDVSGPGIFDPIQGLVSGKI